MIEPNYNQAHPFRGGRAKVHEGGELVLVEDAPFYWEGGIWWMIDPTGNKIGKIAD